MAYIAALEQNLRETEETLNAIRGGDVDAVVVTRGRDDPRVYTLENADRPYRALIEQMHEGAITVSGEGTLLYCNRRFAEMVRLPHERIPGSPLERFVPEADRETLARLMGGSARGGSRGELAIRSADGRNRPVYLSLIDLVNEGERIICGVVADLSEQKRTVRKLHGLSERLATESQERERAEAQLRQAQKMEVVGQLTGGIAHDFNNLLTVIIGSLQQVQDRAPSDDKIVRRIDAALLAADRGARLTRQLLAFSRRQDLRPQVINLSDFMSGVEALVRSTIGAEIAIEFAATSASYYCRTDPNQLEAALFNLCINARDAMPGGGRLMIAAEEVELDEAAAAAVPNATPGRYARISVADTGVGMTPEVLARVFEPFFTTKGVGKGSGLGLSQVYGFVQQSGGTVTIASEPGKGSEVSLYLPSAHAPAVESSSAPQTMHSGTPARLTVLVVEDDPAVRQLSTELIEGLGHTVISAGDATEALALVDATPDIGLLFTDVALPHGVNGVELAREVQRRQRDVAVLLTSGFTALPVVADPSFTDMEILWKPFRGEDLELAITAAIERAEQSKQAAGDQAAPYGARRILVVEDEPSIAMLLEQMLADLDCTIVGPISRLADAMETAQRKTFDAALLDVRLGNKLVYPLADALAARRVPFAFMTGFGDQVHPAPHRGRPILAKPYDAAAVRDVLGTLLPER